MSAPLWVVTGTGTGIGKTAFASALVAARAQRGGTVAGIKPVESGVTADTAARTDVAVLGQASTFHVTRFTPPYLLESPVSPHLAARREGRRIDLDVISDWVASVRAAADVVVLELPGGLYSPLTDNATNATLAARLAPTAILLVAADRLGVLHDVAATTRAAQADGLRIHGVILSAPEVPDASTGTNAEELGRVFPNPPVLASLPRLAHAELRDRLNAVLDELARISH